MTLVIAGYDLEKSISYWHINDQKFTVNGIFIVADSAISSNKKTLLNGFKKVYPIAIKLWEPYFVGEHFRSYLNVYQESQCFIAFSGSTLIAQHVLNVITEHLGKLRISYQLAQGLDTSGKYVVIRHCQSNILTKEGGINTWDEDMFTKNDYQGILTADVLAQVIEYSINEAISSARQYKLDENSFKSMFTDFIAGIQCPKSLEYKLFVFRMDTKLNDEGVLDVFSTRKEVLESEIVVLGMREKFEGRANDVFTKTIANGDKPAVEIFKFLNEAILEVRDTGSREIDFPSSHKIFDAKGLSIVEMKRDAT